MAAVTARLTSTAREADSSGSANASVSPDSSNMTISNPTA